MSASGSQRYVLFISYYFPPSAGSGVQRPLKLVKYLQDYGWTPIVLTVDPEHASFPGIDESMVNEIPDTIEVHRTKSWDPYSMYASMSSKKKDDVVSVGFVSEKKAGWKDYLARWVRANVFIPDARRGWFPYALEKGSSLIATKPIKAVITTGPPHSTHLVGRDLQKQFGLPWIADMRDPWTKVYYADQFPTTPIARWFNERLEQSVLDKADSVVTVTPSMQTAFQAQTETPCINIYNGFDPADFSAPPPAKSEDRFTLSFVGNLMADQNPSALWQVIKEEQAKGHLEKLLIQLVGNADQGVLLDLKRLDLSHLVEQHAYVPHHEAIQFMQSGSALLLPINRGPAGKGILTGKLFEYLATGNPILGIGPTDGDAAHVLSNTGAGKMLDYEDTQGIRDTLTHYYTSWKNKGSAITVDEQQVSQFNRKEQAGQMARLLDSLT